MESLSASWSKFEKSGDPKDYLAFCKLRGQCKDALNKAREEAMDQS